MSWLDSNLILNKIEEAEEIREEEKELYLNHCLYSPFNTPLGEALTQSWESHLMGTF